jgi:hypothetical protein
MYCWRPFYLYDWMFGFDSFWGPSSWAGHYGPGYPFGQNASFPQPPKDVISSVRKDQLKKNDSPSLPMPKEMKKAFGATLAALKRGDQALLTSVEGLPRFSAIIKKQDFLSSQWQEKVISFERLAKEVEANPKAVQSPSFRRSADVSRAARLTIEHSRAIIDLKTRTANSSSHPRPTGPLTSRDMGVRTETAGAGGREAAAPPSFRFRDWNPDVRVAISLGVEISYSTRTNEVACPQLGLSSRQIRTAMRTMIQAPSGSSPARGSSSSSGQASVSGSPSRSSGHSQSSGSSGSQKQKN